MVSVETLKGHKCEVAVGGDRKVTERRLKKRRR